MRAHRGSSGTDGGVDFEEAAGVVVGILHSSYGAESMMLPIAVELTPIFAFKSEVVIPFPPAILETPTGSLARMGALAGPGIITNNKYEDPHCNQWVNKPTQRRRYDVEQNANRRS